MSYSTRTLLPVYASTRLRRDVHFAAKCYTPEKSNPRGLTLLLFHCIGSHKEAWEPTLQLILASDALRTGLPTIREVWSFDMPNHGEAAQNNRDLLKSLKQPLTVDDYAESVRHFIATGILRGHRLVCIGHSLGATAQILTTISELEGPAPVVYEAIIMVEPPLQTLECWEENIEAQNSLIEGTARGALRRRDTWDSREDAKRYFEERFPWDSWNSQVLELYVHHGLRELESPTTCLSGVTLCCPKEQEGPAYAYLAGHFRAVEHLRSGLDPFLPVHWVTGEDEDIAPEYIHQSMMRLRPVASAHKVPNAGHFVVQQNPEGLANALIRVLFKVKEEVTLARL
ncbi:alpha/beta-hydrolase [Trametes meyenii]|nr:alpha/beta-hydrolase [Trametes meyenii]